MPSISTEANAIVAVNKATKNNVSFFIGVNILELDIKKART